MIDQLLQRKLELKASQSPQNILIKNMVEMVHGTISMLFNNLKIITL